MNYEKVKELLLDDSRKLTATEADEILRYLQQNPRAHAWLMSNKKCIQYIEYYRGFNNDTELHEFVLSNVRVPSLKIATKFFETCDYLVIDFFIKLMVLPQLYENDNVFSWPYMSEKIIQKLPEDVIKLLCFCSSIVFNFKNDTDLKQITILLKLLEDDINYLELLAVNSYNIDWGKLSSIYKGRISDSLFVKLFTLSSHFFSDLGLEYASVRKSFSHYMQYCIFFQEKLERAKSEARGIVYN